MGDSIAYTSAKTLARRIRAGELSPVTVVETFLDRIDRYNDTINAFVTIRDEEARANATAAEAAITRGDDLGPLHGVPVAIKDTTAVKDTLTTFGSQLFTEYYPDRDAIVVERLKAAGAIIIGKTNTPEFARKVDTTNTVFGTTSNPWEVSRTVGGSSGGSAAAVAAGLVPLAQGTDWGGSVRIPASACGIVGLKPDFGRIPDRVRPNAFVTSHPYIVHGPLTRTVRDTALMMDVIAGPHRDDPYSLPEPSETYAESAERTGNRVTIAYCPDLGVCPVSQTVTQTVTEALDALSATGISVSRIDPLFDEFDGALHDAISTLLQDRYIAIYEDTQTNHGIDILARRDDVSTEVVSRIERALDLTPRDIHRAERTRTRAFDLVQRVFETYDVLATPTLGVEPFPKGAEPTDSGGGHFNPESGFLLTWPFNLTGHPVLSLPAGWSTDGLPIGLQLIGPRLVDTKLLEVGTHYETANPWIDQYPPTQFP